MIDQIIVGAYLAITLTIGLYVGRNVKNMREFAIGNRDFSTVVLLSAVFASIVEASDTMGLAEEVFTNGPIYCFSYLGVALSHFTLAFFIAPKLGPYLGMLSSGDILEKLYGKRAKTLMGFSTIFESTLLAGAQILAISQIAQYFFNISGDLAAIFASVIMVVYSFRGGIRSVTATDVFQFGIMIVAIPIVCGIGLIKAGGYSSIISVIKTEGFHFQRPDGITYGKCAALFASFALPCLYPLCIQRMLMAKNTLQIRKAFILHGLLGIPFYLIISLIGLVAFSLMPSSDPTFALPNLINNVLPIGLKGFVIAGLLSIFMSTIDSIFHMGSIAITHDAVGSLIKSPLSNETQLRLTRLSTLLIAFGAILVAVWFTNILDVIYFMMVLGNSVFFPGYLLGITGVSKSAKSFWWGVGAGLFTAIICLSIFDMYPLYTMLIAIAANSTVHILHLLITHRLENYLPPRLKTKLSISPLAMFQSHFLVKNKDYCNIFSVCSIGLSIYPFFIFTGPDLNTTDYVFLLLNTTIAILSFFILFAELWWSFFARNFAKIWGLTLTLALPTQTYFILIQSKFSLIWLCDAIVIIPLMTVLTTKRALPLLSVAGLFIALLLSFPIQSTSHPFISSFGYAAILLHMVVLALCLALFRKRDVEMYRFAGSTLVHETKRSLFAFESALNYYEERLPILISGYQLHVPEYKKGIPNDELQAMLTMPKDLQSLSEQTRNFLTKILSRVSTYSHETATKDLCNVNECLNTALRSPAIKQLSQSIISIENTYQLRVLGDSDQIVQVFINLIENALHALDSTKNPKINIKINPHTVLITDNGEGIHENDLPNIFEEFFSTKSSSGQGLAFCKQVMSEHGGTIRCESEKGKFTRFELKFPPFKEGA